MNTYIVTTIEHNMVETVLKARDEEEALAMFKDGLGDERAPELLSGEIKSIELEPEGAW